MATRSTLASNTFNSLYSKLRGYCGSLYGTSFDLKTFCDGSAFVSVNITYSNSTISLTFLCISILDEEGKIVGWRYTDDNKIAICKNLSEASYYMSSAISRAKTNLSKIK